MISGHADVPQLVLEGASHAGMNILSPNGYQSAIYFGSASSNREADIIWDDNANSDGTLSIITRQASSIITFGTANAERLRILTGGGLTFNGDTATANALDDYEEGTFTPAFASTAGVTSVGYASRDGHYTKIGNRVFFNCYVQLNSKITDTGGYMKITGLPFTNGSSVSAMTATGMSRMSLGDSAQYRGVARVYSSAAFMYLFKQKQATDTSDVQLGDDDYTLNAIFAIEGNYRV